MDLPAIVDAILDFSSNPVDTPPASLTDVQRAARFFYLQKNAYAGLIARRNFKLCVEKTPNFTPAQRVA